MRLVCDEGVERPIVDRLRSGGHDVVYVAELQPSSTDDEVLDLANRQDALLITPDKDFGELIFRQGRITGGVLLLRLAGLTNDEKARLVSTAIQAHDAELRGSFAVLSTNKLRIRRAD